MGADSVVDQKLVGFAKAGVESRDFALAIIASSDGGIFYDCTKLGLAGTHVYCHMPGKPHRLEMLGEQFMARVQGSL